MVLSFTPLITLASTLCQKAISCVHCTPRLTDKEIHLMNHLMVSAKES